MPSAPHAASLLPLRASSTEAGDDAPAVRYLQKLLLDAVSAGASDIHLEPFEHYCRLRLRIDGELRDIVQPPLALRDKLASRIKVLASLDIAEKRLPQDGRMQLVLSKTRTVDLRVSTMPTLHGEKIVLRVLGNRHNALPLTALGYERRQEGVLRAAIGRPHGMVLMTGPTGSGKTVSLYACLHLLNQSGVNICSVEDPVEIELPGVNQVHLNERAGLDFPTALRAFLRQDPDVLMVGEIRDTDTADIAIKAAQTGHLVLSTLHTIDAPAAITRLLNMGVPAFNLAASLSLITAQRLVRRLCDCKQPHTADAALLRAAGFGSAVIDSGWHPWRATGCERCGGSGYRGRIGIYQLMPVSPAINELILARAGTTQIAAQATREGVLSLRQAGLSKVHAGLISLDDLLACSAP